MSAIACTLHLADCFCDATSALCVSACPRAMSDMFLLPRRDCGTEGKLELGSTELPEKSSKPLSGVICFPLVLNCFLNALNSSGTSAWQCRENVKVLSAVTSELYSCGHSHFNISVFVVTETLRNEDFGGICSTAPCCPSASVIVGLMSGRSDRGTSDWVGGLVVNNVRLRALSKFASICLRERIAVTGLSFKIWLAVREHKDRNGWV